MKKIFTLLSACALFLLKGNSQQVVLNELYTDPGSSKHEFFELYNPSTSAVSLDNYTLLCFFDISGNLGWYVMDLPNLSVPNKGYFVGSAALPFNYQGITNSTASDFSWNSTAFTSNNGYVKKWIQGTANLSDGNQYYDQLSLPANFNDFLFRRVSSGASYSVFLYHNGLLVNTFLGGTGASATMLNDIINLPPLYIDMTSTSPDFTINFSGYGSLPIESTSANAGSDNGYIRVADGACASWVKSSAQVNHTPKITNGSLGSSSASISVSSAISPGTPATGSTVNYDIVGAPNSAFPIEMQIYRDNGTVVGQLDAGDTYVEANTENNISQGPFYTTFFPYNSSILIVVKTNAGCLDQVKFIPNSIPLSVASVTSFYGSRNNAALNLNWNVEQNESISHFELQQSTDGQSFSTAALVFATNNNGQQTYSYNTSAPVSGTVVYRLQVFNKNSSTTYSKTLSFGTNESIRKPLSIINNNAVVDKLSLNYQASNNRLIDIRIFDMGGRLVQHTNANVFTGINGILVPLAGHTRSGIYIVDLIDGGKHYTEKFIRQ